LRYTGRTNHDSKADAVKAGDIYVIDWDTIDAFGKRIRLVGFDAPELGDRAPTAASGGCSPPAPHRGFAKWFS
jgi:endonuclease YncB( thermonuclease family)